MDGWDPRKGTTTHFVESARVLKLWALIKWLGSHLPTKGKSIDLSPGSPGLGNWNCDPFHECLQNRHLLELPAQCGLTFWRPLGLWKKKGKRLLTTFSSGATPHFLSGFARNQNQTNDLIAMKRLGPNLLLGSLPGCAL